VALLTSLAAELAITMADGRVWLAIGQALLLGGGCLLFGTWMARAVGLLRPDAPAGETLGVGLASGLLVLAAWWAAIWSGGRSSFTPVAVGFAIALGLALVGRARRPLETIEPAPGPSGAGDAVTPTPAARRRSLVLAVLAGAVFVVAVALLYGATMAPSPRDGVQPVEMRDPAFYAVLGRDLATTGTETNLPPSGFNQVPGEPSQTWYHWGELWLAAAVITFAGTAPLAARYFVVLPLLLLASAALTGTLVRRLTGTASRKAYMIGFLACLFLAPIPLFPGPFFDQVLFGLIYGISPYGLGAVAVLLALCGLAVLGARPSTWTLAFFAGSAAASILPAHIAIALLALIGVGSVGTVRVVQSLLATRRLPAVSPAWRRTIIVTAVALVATVAWGMLTRHGLPVGALPAGVAPFNAIWHDSVAIVILGAGVFLAIPIAWLLARRDAPLLADLCLGALVVLVVGAIAWGARLGDFNMFYFFFGGIAVFAMPAAAAAGMWIWIRLRTTRHTHLATAALLLFVAQLEVGVGIGVLQMHDHGPGAYPPIPLSLLTAIKDLPSGARLAYACRPFEEFTFGTPQLLAIEAHTGRGVVPMCFEADVFSVLSGAKLSSQAPNADSWAPQRALYPSAGAHPSSAAVAAFLKGHGIDYIYVDAIHPNTLVADAVPIARSGDFEVLRVP
jgi:hypothetical protein